MPPRPSDVDEPVPAAYVVALTRAHSLGQRPDCPGVSRRAADDDAAVVLLGHRLPGFVARMVDPMAPYLAALRRVSSNVERA
jgi:hypothetical protein